MPAGAVEELTLNTVLLPPDWIIEADDAPSLINLYVFVPTPPVVVIITVFTGVGRKPILLIVISVDDITVTVVDFMSPLASSTSIS